MSKEKPVTEQDILDRAKEVAARFDVKLEALRGKRIRVLRAVVYEGEAEAVFRQLARSLPPGTRKVKPWDSTLELTITVVEGHTIKVIK